ncbi:F-box only protein 7-like [Hylaeus anthracinus]|uniref:F-box only protein 7-like n=1 Tax=Hylaeus anthracinus TaxID=313031 RepID=UPI0023B91CE9|nr:F-box only protein 7-like [Hylaeus anthracinus]
MSEPILAEDSTIMKLVPSLEGILKDLDENAKAHDYLVALVIVFLSESGFYVSSSDKDHSQNLRLRPLHIPKDWKSKERGIYEICFQLGVFSEVKCKLVAIPSQDTIILNFFPLTNEKQTYCMCIQTLMYVNPFSSDLSGRYRNLKAISHRFKDVIATPMRSDLLIRANLMGPSLLCLPMECKLKILTMLDVHSISQMALCCSEFHRLSYEPVLWQKLLQRDYPQTRWESINDCKHIYQECYRNQQSLLSSINRHYPHPFFFRY